MDPKDKVVAVTGAASGIGRALALEFARQQAAHVAVLDLNHSELVSCAAEIKNIGCGSSLHVVNVGQEREISETLSEIVRSVGPIDIMCSNAGIARGGGPEAPEQAWLESWQVNLMAHVYAARALLPSMVARGSGYFVHTASAAGLLTNIGAAPYTVTKHAAVGLAEWLAITYRDQGIRVSCLCPQGVRTPMLFPPSSEDPEGLSDHVSQASVLSAGELREPEEVAMAVIEGVREERFLILPHPEVHDYLARKVADPDRWIAGMARYARRLSDPI